MSKLDISKWIDLAGLRPCISNAGATLDLYPMPPLRSVTAYNKVSKL